MTASIEGAVLAFERYELSQSLAIYRLVIANSATSRDDHVKAHMAFARDAWKFKIEAGEFQRRFFAAITALSNEGFNDLSNSRQRAKSRSASISLPSNK